MNYSLHEASDGSKVETFGDITLKRPDPLAVFAPQAIPYPIDSTFTNTWSHTLDPWVVDFGLLKMNLSLGKTKHVGVFPEHHKNWEWMHHYLCQTQAPVSVLNVFGYTGGATIACALAPCVQEVVHVDALKSVLETCKTNIEINHLEDKTIRRIQEDALKFMKREHKRGRIYQAIIMDPPSFGRGPKGETWVLEEMIDALLEATFDLTDDSLEFLAINTYSTKLSAEDVLEKARLYRNDGIWDILQLELPIEGTQDALAQGTTVRWRRHD